MGVRKCKVTHQKKVSLFPQSLGRWSSNSTEHAQLYYSAPRNWSPPLEYCADGQGVKDRGNY